MSELVFEFSARLTEHGAEPSWVMLTLPVDDAEDIRELVPVRPGFGSVPVGVQIGSAWWRTSIFPDSKSGSYVLPVKRAVREQAGVDVGDVVDVTLRLVPDL